MGNELFAKSLVDLWMHQNNLMWSRVRSLSALQAAALVANYVLHNKFASLGLCAIAIVATGVLIYMSDVDRMIRDKFQKQLQDDYNFRLGFTPEERKIIHVYIFGSFSVPAILTSKSVLRLIFWTLMVCDGVVLVASVTAFP
jgi:hypothetical protein